jgi:hypothetical protein
LKQRGFSRRKQKFVNKRRQKNLILVIVLAVLGLFLFLSSWQFNAPLELELREPVAAAGVPISPDLIATMPPPRRRPEYPYSVISGGAHGPEELRESIRRDRVVAEHFSDFNASRARLVKLDRSFRAHVSYRIGNQVFWTRRKLTLAKDELLLTDGETYARTRCGNQISEDPQEPTSDKEPDAEEFDEPYADPPSPGPSMPIPIPNPAPPLDPPRTGPPVPLPPVPIPPFVPPPPGFPPMPPPGGPPGGNNPPLPPGDGPDPLPPIFPPGEDPLPPFPPGGPPGGNPPWPPGDPPPIPVPEPGTMLLLSIGLSGLYAVRRLQKR